MKRVASFVLILLIASSFAVNPALAAINPIIYERPVKVRLTVKNPSTQVIGNKGLYKLTNLENNQVFMLRPNTTLTSTKTSTGTNVKLGGINIHSSKGFLATEMAGAAKLVSFTGTTEARTGASTTSPVKITYVSGETSEFVSETSVNGEAWFIIKGKDGSQLAVKKGSTTVLENAPALSLFTVTGNGKTYRGSFQIETTNTIINQLALELYLKGVVPNESYSSWHIEALKAQAVTARSYAAYKGITGILNDGQSDQVYKGYGTEVSATNRAVDETKNKVVTYNGKVIMTFYYSSSGGRTANYSEVWNPTSVPYYKSVNDQYDFQSTKDFGVQHNSKWQYAVSASELLSRLATQKKISAEVAASTLYGLNLTNVNGPGTEVNGIILETSSGPISLTGKKENEVRSYFPTTKGSLSYNLPSSWFTITANKEYAVQNNDSQQSVFSIKNATIQKTDGVSILNDANVSIQMANTVVTKPADPKSIIIDGKGFGHRIGMSQFGAQGYAKYANWDYKKILTHYFQGTQITDL